jgi:hypothetical protein
MSTELVAIIAGLVALSTGLLRLLEGVWKNFKSNNSQPQEQDGSFVATGLTQDEHDWLKEMHTIVTRSGDDGTYLLYVPRSLGDVQKEIVTALNSITIHQEKMTFILEQLCNRIDK